MTRSGVDKWISRLVDDEWLRARDRDKTKDSSGWDWLDMSVWVVRNGVRVRVRVRGGDYGGET